MKAIHIISFCSYLTDRKYRIRICLLIMCYTYQSILGEWLGIGFLKPAYLSINSSPYPATSGRVGSTDRRIPNSSILARVPSIPHTYICPYQLLSGQCGSNSAPLPSTRSPRIALTKSSSSRLITWPNHCSRCSPILSLLSTTPRLPWCNYFYSCPRGRPHSCNAACASQLPASCAPGS